MLFTQTVPARILGAMSSARLTFSVHTLAASPYTVLLASSTASAGVRNVIETTTGPKISTCAMVDDGETSVKSVGGKKHPSWGQLHEGCHMVAPSDTPCSTRRWIC